MSCGLGLYPVGRGRRLQQGTGRCAVRCRGAGDTAGLGTPQLRGAEVAAGWAPGPSTATATATALPPQRSFPVFVSAGGRVRFRLFFERAGEVRPGSGCACAALPAPTPAPPGPAAAREDGPAAMVPVSSVRLSPDYGGPNLPRGSLLIVTQLT